ncbi:Uncharacterised protein [Streptococcus pneumoniae]|nr:Uncharacterised protein [Streptococcus pneumoniae]
MFYLNTSIHLHEIEIATCFIKKKFNGSCILIANKLCRSNSSSTYFMTQRFSDCNRGTFFQNLLVIPLKRTIPFTQVNHMSMLIT